MKNKIEIECQSCKATGLYSGMAEKDGCAVICSNCDGTGKDTIDYTPFSKKKLRKDIKRVFKSSFGYGHTSEDYKTKDGFVVQFSKGGCTYEEWLAGAKPKPVKDLYCPYLWTNQELQSKDKNNLYKSKCNLALKFGSISDCRHWKTKSSCWEIYEGK